MVNDGFTKFLKYNKSIDPSVKCPFNQQMDLNFKITK